MSALEKLKEQQQASDMSAVLMSRLEAVEEQTRELTEAVNKVSGFLKAMDEAQTAELKRLSGSISQQHEQPSQPQLDDETKSRLSEIEKTLAAVAKQLSASGAVKLSDGTEVKRSDLDAFTMMKNLKSQQETVTTSLDELTKTVGNGRTVRIDMNRLSEYAVGVLDERLAQAVEGPVQRVENTLDEVEQRVAVIGTQKASEAAQAVERVTDKADELVASVGRAERRLEALEGRMTWTAVGRVCLALVPFAAVLLVLGGLTMGSFYTLGFGPLLGWAWGSFEAASTWWAKGLIAVATLGGVAGFTALVLRLAGRLRDEFGSW
ncbi:MAG: hypothetical protein SO046_10310 [Actinomyces urogenitalis]|uniref:hypothetical protein n=1 Tax=Actinomyces urogenitalis TaxID=103621 RepID=UPI002A80A309|nr:hypothetical protein [Actinomyces urogenitalis]MDY3679588.1 hypothetical protein [Actinomyces urogenitalis]